MLTMAFVSFIVVLVKVVLGGTAVTIGSLVLNVEPISPELAGVLLGTQTAGYVFRRHTDRKFPGAVAEEDTEAPPEGPQQ